MDPILHMLTSNRHVYLVKETRTNKKLLNYYQPIIRVDDASTYLHMTQSPINLVILVRLSIGPLSLRHVFLEKLSVTIRQFIFTKSKTRNVNVHSPFSVI